MKRFLIEDVKYEISPFDTVGAAVKFTCDGESKWLYNVEVDGFPNFYLCDGAEDKFDLLFNASDEEEELVEQLVEQAYITELGGMNIQYYEDCVDSINENPDNEYIPLLRYILFVTRGDCEDVDPFLEKTKGKYLDEIEIPLCDYETDED